LGGKDFQEDGRSIDEEGYETFLLADHASEWIRKRDPERRPQTQAGQQRMSVQGDDQTPRNR
ncbi:MAG: hypothetical protein ACPGUV_14090, partial [Polyangiales bacterium]